MKKLFVLSLAILGGLFAGCSSDDEQQPVPVPDPDPVVDEVDTEVTMNTVVTTMYEAGDAADSYYLMLASGELVFDEEEFYYHTVEEGYTMMICLHAAPASDPSQPVLPAGTYTLSSAVAPGSWDSDPELCSLDYYKPGEGSAPILPVSGSLTVAEADGGYELQFLFEDAEGLSYKVVYRGELTFTGVSAGDGVLQDPVDTEFIGGQALYFGADASFPSYGYVQVELWDADAESGAAILGNMVKLKLFVDFPQGTFTQVPAGIYTIDWMNVGPFFAEAGWDDGENLPTGCYIAQTYDTMLLGMLCAGTVEITEEGCVTLDAVTDEGVSVKGRLNAPLEVRDLSGGGNTGPSGPFSTLAGDVDITTSFSDRAVAGVTEYGDYFQNGTRNAIVQIIDETRLTVMNLDLILPAAEAGALLPEITCTVGSEMEPFAGTFLPGNYLWGNFTGTFFGTLERIGDDYMVDAFGPAVSGTLSVKPNGDGTYTFLFDLKDDAETPHAISGSWSGPLVWLSNDALSVSKRKR